MEININPVIFWNVRWYGVFIALAIATILLWTWWRIKKEAALSYDDVMTAALVAIPSGVVFARLLHVIDNIVVAKLHPELALTGQVIDYTRYPGLIIGGAGLAIWGGILGAALGLWIYSKFRKFPLGYLLDIMAPAVILGQVLGRMGCLINGCSYGAETSVPWALIYTHPDSLAPLGVPTHPTPVYEIIYLLASFGVVMWLRGRLKPDGSLFLVYLSLYALWRLGSDFVRIGTPFILGLHQAQVVAIIVLAITITALVRKTRWVSREAGGGTE